jgi:hypothetical protein
MKIKGGHLGRQHEKGWGDKKGHKRREILMKLREAFLDLGNSRQKTTVKTLKDRLVIGGLSHSRLSRAKGRKNNMEEAVLPEELKRQASSVQNSSRSVCE